MRLLQLYLLLLLSIFFVFIGASHAAINYSVTPIRYELELQPGESITLPASIRNNGTGTVTLPTTTSDFQSSGPGGVPSIVRKSELVYPDQQLSTWITLGDSSVTLAPGEEGTVTFTIDVPTTATPGGHYGAVLFQNTGSESGGGNISINVDYGIIILVTVAGEIITDVNIGDPIISGGGTGGFPRNDPNSESSSSGTGGVDESSGENTNPVSPRDENDGWYIGMDENGDPMYIYPDVCPLGDFTTSKYDNRCFGASEPNLFSNIGSPNITDNDSEGILFENDFEVNFSFPIENKGNTHIKPSGKIVLKDENGVIKAIGREVIANDRGAIIDQKIVDYVPINDQGGNILPLTKRIFESQWQGFPYKTFDDEGNPIINYWSPSEYYTQKNKEDAGFLMFWERVSENRTHKDITADIQLVYYDENGEPIEFNTSKTFTVQYIEQVVSLNPYIILGMLLIFAALILTLGAMRWWVVLFKENTCWSCGENIKSHWKTCPHCRAIQNKRKHKAFEKQKESTTPNKAKTRPKSTTTKKKSPVKKKTGAKK